MSISSISRLVNQVVSHPNSLSSNQAKNTRKKLTDLPKEVLLQIAEDLFSSKNISFKDFQNFQYACKLFLQIGQAALQSSFWWSFFDFKNNQSESDAKVVNKKIYEWLGVRRELKNTARWRQLDNLIRAPGSKPFDVPSIWNLLRYGHYINQPLSSFVDLGVLKKENIDGLVLSKVQENYVTSESGLISILKETPDFHFFKKIPDNFFRLGNYNMIKKAMEEDENVFNYMVESKICLYYPNSFSGLEPFIEAVSKSSEEKMMRVLYPYINANACYMVGKNAIHFAAEYGNVNALIFLRDKGVDFKKRDDKGRSPLFLSVLSCSQQHQAFTRKLIEYGESASVVDNDGNTILMVAAQESDSLLCNDFFSYLIKSGANINAVNNFDENILHILFRDKKFEKFFRLNKLFVERGVFDVKEMLQIAEIYGEGKFLYNMAIFINDLLNRSKSLLLMKNKNRKTPVDNLKRKFGEKSFEYILNVLDKFNKNHMLSIDSKLLLFVRAGFAIEYIKFIRSKLNEFARKYMYAAKARVMA